MGAFGFVVGGCWYRLQCRESVASSIASLAYLSGQMGAPFLGISVRHTSNLWTGRCQWLHAQLEKPDAKWAIAVDSDTAFDAGSLLAAFARLDRADIAIGCAPVRVGGTASICNLNLRDGDEANPLRDESPSNGEHRVTSEELLKVLEGEGEIASGGFGVAVFCLDWFRANWPRPYPELVSADCKEQWVGEDIAFCRSVRRRGGKVIALPVHTDHHEFKP